MPHTPKGAHHILLIELLQVINGSSEYLLGGLFLQKGGFGENFVGIGVVFWKNYLWEKGGGFGGIGQNWLFECFVAISLPIFGVSDPKSEQKLGDCFFCRIFWRYCCRSSEFGDWWDENWGYWDMRKMGFLNIAICYPEFGVTNRGVLRGKMYQIAYKNWDVFVTSLLPDSQQTP